MPWGLGWETPIKETMKKQKTLEPQQADFLDYYLNPKSPTYSNATQSALKAGYNADYAKQITARSNKWLDTAKERQTKIVDVAEKRLLEFVSDKKDKRVASDMAKFALKTLGKNKGYTEKIEVNNKNTNIVIGKEELDNIISKYS